MKMNKKYLAWGIIIIVLFNIGFISACITDQYITSGTFWYSDTWVGHSESERANENMDFKYDSVTGWNGSGTINKVSSWWDSFGPGKSSSNTTITCNAGNCIENVISTYNDGHIESYSNKLIGSPKEHGYLIESCACPDQNYVKKYTSNCQNHYTLNINGDCIQDNGRICKYSFEYITHKDGFCCDSNGDCNLDSDDFVCDFNASKYNAGYCGDGFCVGGHPGWIERPEDDCNNIDTDGKGYDTNNDRINDIFTKDACCPATLGAAEKYIVNKGEKVLVRNPDPVLNAACHLLDSTSCYDDYDCEWDPFIGCIAQSIEICNDTGADKCVKCTSSTVEKDCGVGQACCDGKCYDKRDKGGCCGSGECQELRTDVCVEGGTCYIEGKNTECMRNSDVEGMNKALKPEFRYEPLKSDETWTIVGHLRKDINEQIFSLHPTGDPYLGYDVSIPLIDTWVVDDPMSIYSPGDLSAQLNVDDKTTVFAGLAAWWKVRTKETKVQTGVEKVWQEGQGGGEGTGRVSPGTWTYIPVYKNVDKECSTELKPAAIAGIEHWLDKNWKTDVSVISDLEKSAACVGVVFSKNNIEIGCHYMKSFGDPACLFQDGGVVFGLKYKF